MLTPSEYAAIGRRVNTRKTTHQTEHELRRETEIDRAALWTALQEAKHLLSGAYFHDRPDCIAWNKRVKALLESLGDQSLEDQ